MSVAISYSPRGRVTDSVAEPSLAFTDETTPPTLAPSAARKTAPIPARTIGLGSTAVTHFPPPCHATSNVSMVSAFQLILG